MKSNHYNFPFLLLFVCSVCSNLTNAQVTKFDLHVARQFARQWMDTPQEKAYLQTDKPYYSVGENIWFKGYVVNATTHIPKTFSQFLYVELIDKSNSIITRVKIKKDSLGFAGYLTLKPEMEAGNYSLRAYTNWMQNATPDFFFSKNILICNPIDDHITGKINFGKLIHGKIDASICFNDQSDSPVSDKSINLIQNWNNPQNTKNTLKTDKDGKINFQITVDTLIHGTKYIDVSITESGLNYKKRMYLPEFSSDYDVQFFPESGNVLSDTLQVIAFKAVGANGLSVAVTGKVYSGTHQEIAEFSSTTKGMGKFSVNIPQGERYYVKVTTDKGVEKTIYLPLSQPHGIGLHMVQNRGKILYEVINKTTIPNSALYLLIHSRGKVLDIHQLNILQGQLPESIFPAGITSFSVIDSVGNTYCERLYFARTLKSPIIKMESNKEVYTKRDSVDLKMNIVSLTGKPVTGNFSISVTDNHSVKLDSLTGNIQNYLLLSSDIKGYVEDPASYFSSNLFLDHENLDLLMLTQAWRRFNTSDIVKGKYKEQPFFMEAGQTLSGKVVNAFNKPSVKCGIILISLYKAKIKLAQTDSLGRYLIDGIEFPDSTTLVIKANKAKTFGNVEIIPDEEVIPKSSVFIPGQQEGNSLAIAEYLKQSREKYYMDGGMRAINLDAVTVKAAKIDKSKSAHYYSGMEDTKFSSERLDTYPGMTILDVLSMMPGVQVDGGKVSIRGSQNEPLFVIDEIPSNNMDDITYLTTNDVDEISLFKGASAAIFGSKGGSGVIAISLKKGYVRKAEKPINVITVTPLGFQKPSQFYVPKYGVDSILKSSQPDLRTTIYWNPKLIADSNGTVHVKFFTADKSTNYSIVMEGITNSGEICRYTGILKREDK